jgi:tripartite-type tricarboxylate transporter receptor subunit TctC
MDVIMAIRTTGGEVKRSLSRAGAAAMIAWAASATPAAHAQAYPVKPIRIIVPVAAGGNLDIVARAIAAPMSETFGQQVIVEARPGASSLVGTATHC